MTDEAAAPAAIEKPVVLITGATRGIGRAVAEALGHDHHILVGGRDELAARRVAASLPSAHPWVCDLTDAADVERASAQVKIIDTVVHSAGIEAMGSVEGLDRQQWRDVFELNVVAVADFTRLLLPKLRERSGMVVTINSGSGFTAHPQTAAYSASKFALTAFTDALRQEEAGQVRVVSVHPGRVDTEMQQRIQAVKQAEYNPGDHLSVEAVAQVVAMAVRMPKGSNIPTVRVNPDTV